MSLDGGTVENSGLARWAAAWRKTEIGARVSTVTLIVSTGVGKEFGVISQGKKSSPARTTKSVILPVGYCAQRIPAFIYPPMSISAFDVIGPSMIGPSSSHTAGALRIGLMARALADGNVADADVVFHGSFADTGRGHATDRGIVAGLLGLAADDECLKDSLELAAQQGVSVRFSTEDLGQ